MELEVGFTAASVLALAFVSAIVPWVNAEVLVLTLPAVAHSRAGLAGLVLLVAAGQMAGKCIVYFAGSRGARIGSGRLADRVTTWQARASASPRHAIALVAISSTVGLPPFYVMSAIAGAVRVNFAWFLAAGTLGRLVRFGAIACGALSVWPNP